MRIDGRELAQNILDNLKKEVENLQQTKHIIPHLGVIVVGNDAATQAYVRQKKRMGEEIGGMVSIYNYPENIQEKQLEQSIDFLQKEGSLHGLIIQLPLPKHLNEEALTNRVTAENDVDGFRKDSFFDEPIALAVIRILKEIFILEQAKSHTKEKEFKKWLSSQHVVVMGKGKTGGQPILSIMKKYDITPTIVDSKTQSPWEVTKKADILICAVGGRGTLVTEDMIKKDAILIGIGMHMGTDGKLHGDYDAAEIEDKAAYYTPVPGGVGPVNAAMLLVNVVESAKQSGAS